MASRATARGVAAAACSLLVLLLVGDPAVGHTGFESSEPGDGAETFEPVDLITLVFTGEAEPSGDGFVVLDGDGTVREPNDISTDGGTTWFLRFDPALGPGTIGVRWEVVAPDAHPIEGTFSFTVRSAVEVAEQPAAPSIQPDAAGDVSAAVAEELEAFLAPSQQPASPGRVAAAARFVGLTGAVVAIGGLIFTAMVLRGEQREIAYVLRWVHVAALLVVVGAISELFAQGVVARGGDWGSIGSVDEIRNTVRSDFGVATGLRLLGAGLIIAGVRAKAASPASAADPGHVLRSWLRAGAAAAIGRPPGQASSTPHSPAPSHGEVWTWNVTTTATVGVVAVVAAPVFDGHTVTEGSRPLTAIADAVHVAASAVWAGGVVMLAAVLILRSRTGRDFSALALGLRFSVVAAVAAVAAGGAGVALTASILDSPAQLWSSDWGRVLMAKSLLVMVAAVMGAYHHWVVLPAMEAAPDNAELAQRFRSTVAVEAVIFVGVVGVTAGLIGAAT